MHNTLHVTVSNLFDYLCNTLEKLTNFHGNSKIFSISFPKIGIAYSGGLDSSVLLHLMIMFTSQHKSQLYALHINHGVSSNANNWQKHCEEKCKNLNIYFTTYNIRMMLHNRKNNFEENARNARYQAIRELCNQYGINLLLTAHHLDDQTETVLLRLLRGCGIAGLSGIKIFNFTENLLSNAKILIARPLLRVSRNILEQYAKKYFISYIEDESNNNVFYTRNLLRHKIIPIISYYFPNFQVRFARTAQHAESAQNLLITLAQQDFIICEKNKKLNILTLRQLNTERIDNLLRYWLMLHHVKTPSTALLLEIRKQLLNYTFDKQICIYYANSTIRNYRDYLYLIPSSTISNKKIKDQFFSWHGEKMIHFYQFSGNLLFQSANVGFNAIWLRQQQLTIKLRNGGEKLKLASNRPIKKLKYYYQIMGIPIWQRQSLPLIFAGYQLLYAAGIGMDCRVQCCVNNTIDSTSKIALYWQEIK